MAFSEEGAAAGGRKHACAQRADGSSTPCPGRLGGLRPPDAQTHRHMRGPQQSPVWKSAGSGGIRRDLLCVGFPRFSREPRGDRLTPTVVSGDGLGWSEETAFPG